MNKSELEEMEKVVTPFRKGQLQIGECILSIEGREDKKRKGEKVDVGTIEIDPLSSSQGFDEPISLSDIQFQ